MFMTGFDFYEVKKNIIFQKEKGKTYTLLNIFIVKSLKKEQNSINLLLWPQSARIKLQSPQSDSTPWTLTLGYYAYFSWELPISFIVVYEFL